ncbi:hypothetical protein ACWDRB_10075 [Nonomuraea sp. NPDC003707]
MLTGHPPGGLAQLLEEGGQAPRHIGALGLVQRNHAVGQVRGPALGDEAA